MKKIKVTKDHIDQGEPQSCFKCPVTLALKDAGYDLVIVSRHNFSIADTIYEWPVAIRGMLRTYDKTGVMSPFSFYIGKNRVKLL